MTYKTSKKELLTILLAGLCLNLSSLHLHSLNEYLTTGEKSGLHLTQEELPFCFACKHLSYGDISRPGFVNPALHYNQGLQVYADKVLYDHTPEIHLNKSPPNK